MPKGAASARRAPVRPRAMRLTWSPPAQVETPPASRNPSGTDQQAPQRAVRSLGVGPLQRLPRAAVEARHSDRFDHVHPSKQAGGIGRFGGGEKRIRHAVRGPQRMPMLAVEAHGTRGEAPPASSNAPPNSARAWTSPSRPETGVIVSARKRLSSKTGALAHRRPVPARSGRPRSAARAICLLPARAGRNPAPQPARARSTTPIPAGDAPRRNHPRREKSPPAASALPSSASARTGRSRRSRERAPTGHYRCLWSRARWRTQRPRLRRATADEQAIAAVGERMAPKALLGRWVSSGHHHSEARRARRWTVPSPIAGNSPAAIRRAGVARSASTAPSALDHPHPAAIRRCQASAPCLRAVNRRRS